MRFSFRPCCTFPFHACSLSLALLPETILFIRRAVRIHSQAHAQRNLRSRSVHDEHALRAGTARRLGVALNVHVLLIAANRRIRTDAGTTMAMEHRSLVVYGSKTSPLNCLLRSERICFDVRIRQKVPFRTCKRLCHCKHHDTTNPVRSEQVRCLLYVSLGALMAHCQPPRAGRSQSKIRSSTSGIRLSVTNHDMLPSVREW